MAGDRDGHDDDDDEDDEARDNGVDGDGDSGYSAGLRNAEGDSGAKKEVGSV